MESGPKSVGVVTPVKEPQLNKSKISGTLKNSENMNPNVTSSPGLKVSKSPVTKSASKAQKSAPRNPNPVTKSPLQKNKIRERKFIVAKKSSRREGLGNAAAAVACKCSKGDGMPHKCLCVAYESLRASQEEFFKNRGAFGDENETEVVDNCDGGEQRGDKNESLIQETENEKGCREQIDHGDTSINIEGISEMGASTIKRTRDRLLEEARECEPEPGSGRVMHLVKAFEKLLSIPKSNESEEKNENEVEDTKKGLKWALPGLKQQDSASETQLSSSSFCPSDFLLTSECLGLDSRRTSSLDGSSRGSISSRTSGGGQRSRRNSAESSGTYARRQRRKRQQLKTTTYKPFKLRTEERGKSKEEEFMKKVQQMMEEEEKLRIPIAQGLPWTTDEPECLVKPPVKETTAPADVVLHSDVRAAERAEFDHQVAEKMSLIDQYKLERERQQKLAEEEEIKRLRKDLVPKAQPMPYFDRPFIPRRSSKNPTIPKDPKFHIPQHKKIKCMQQSWSSWSDMYIQQQ